MISKLSPLSLALFLFPLLSSGQWIKPYVTGEGIGYTQGSKHTTLFGEVLNDTLVLIGEQSIGSSMNPGNEYICDQFNANTGLALRSQILYPYDGDETNSRPLQRFQAYPQGFIVNHSGALVFDSIHYFRGKRGQVQRIDNQAYSLIYSTQSKDSSQAYLVEDANSNLILRNWYSGDTVLYLCESCISQNYQGSFSPSHWILNQYHIDGSTLYLQYYQPGMNLSYGIDVLKFDLNSGNYQGHLHFKTSRFRISNGQSFRIIIEDSITMPVQPTEPYLAYNRVVDGSGQVLGAFSYAADIYQGQVSNTPYFYLNDSIILICTPIQDTRSSSAYNTGTHLRVYSINGNNISSARIFAAQIGSDFEIQQILTVHRGRIYFNTEVESGLNGVDLLGSMPLSLNLQSDHVDIELSTKGFGLLNIDIFPNPCSDYIKIQSSKDYDAVRMRSIDGKEVLQFQYSPKNRYSLQSLSSGLYQVHLLSQGQVYAESTLLKN